MMKQGNLTLGADLSKLSNRTRIGLLVLGLSAIIITFFVFVFLPQREEVQTLTIQLEAKQNTTQVLEAYIAQHPDLDQYSIELEQKFADVSARLPNTLDMSSFLVQLDRAAKDSKVMIMSVKPAVAQPKSGYQEYPIELTVQGSYKTILTFLTNLNKLTRYTLVNDVAADAKLNMLEIKVGVSIFTFGAPAANADQAGKSPTTAETPSSSGTSAPASSNATATTPVNPPATAQTAPTTPVTQSPATETKAPAAAPTAAPTGTETSTNKNQ